MCGGGDRSDSMSQGRSTYTEREENDSLFRKRTPNQPEKAAPHKGNMNYYTFLL